MKKILLILVLLGTIVSVYAQQVVVETVKFADRDSALYMDIYVPQDTIKSHVCIIYVFGGGFATGTRNQPNIVAVMHELAAKGYVCASIDYRLGLKNYHMTNVLDAVNRLERSIDMATEDLMTATTFLYENAERYAIDRNYIISSGSSAGAITSLQADYYLHSNNPMAQILPKDFQYAGILSFAGAVAVFGGHVKYTSQPAPTLFVHGTKDHLVAYDKKVIFGRGMYGADYLTKYFAKNDWLYEIMRYKNFGHEIAWIGIKENIPEIDMFIKRYVLKQGYEAKYGESLDVTVYDRDMKKPIFDVNGLNLYKKDSKSNVSKDSEQYRRFYGE